MTETSVAAPPHDSMAPRPRGVADVVQWPDDDEARLIAYTAHLLAALRKIADGQDDPAWMRVTARRAIAAVTE